MIPRWEVTFSSPTPGLKIAGFTTRFQYACTVTVRTEAEAVPAAKIVRDAKGFADYTRVHGVTRIYRYAVTLKGRADGRKRETFLTWAPTEARAIQNVGYLPAATRFAGYGSKLKANVVKVQVRG